MLALLILCMVAPLCEATVFVSLEAKVVLEIFLIARVQVLEVAPTSSVFQMATSPSASREVSDHQLVQLLCSVVIGMRKPKNLD